MPQAQEPPNAIPPTSANTQQRERVSFDEESYLLARPCGLFLMIA